MKIFKILQIAMQGYNMEYMANYTEPAIATSILFIIVLTVFCIIKLMRQLHYFIFFTGLVIGLVCLGYEFIALRLMASIFELSKEYIELGRKANSPRTLNGKCLKSFRPLRVYSGSFYIENSTVFAYFDSCIENTINILLMA